MPADSAVVLPSPARPIGRSRPNIHDHPVYRALPSDAQQRLIAEGVELIKSGNIDGIDLLGYRFVGDAVKLNHDFCAAVQPYGPVCLAGSVSSYQRLDEVADAGARWRFDCGGRMPGNRGEAGDISGHGWSPRFGHRCGGMSVQELLSVRRGKS